MVYLTWHFFIPRLRNAVCILHLRTLQFGTGTLQVLDNDLWLMATVLDRTGKALLLTGGALGRGLRTFRQRRQKGGNACSWSCPPPAPCGVGADARQPQSQRRKPSLLLRVLSGCLDCSTCI